MSKMEEYKNVLSNLEHAKEVLADEKDKDFREMAELELEGLEKRFEELEEEIRLLLIPADPEDEKMPLLKFVQGLAATRQVFLRAIFTVCTRAIVNAENGR